MTDLEELIRIARRLSDRLDLATSNEKKFALIFARNLIN
jgi:hypothetical protein